MLQQRTHEPIRPPRDPRNKRPGIPNRFANLIQVLGSYVGHPWEDVQTTIFNHPKYRAKKTRAVLQQTLRKLVCRSGRPPEDIHSFVVRDGYLERLTRPTQATTPEATDVIAEA